jgi:hypothetical protein
VLQKYTRVSDAETLEETHKEYRDYIESIPYVSRKGIEAILGVLQAFPLLDRRVFTRCST